jgi:hypothetical protein
LRRDRYCGQNRDVRPHPAEVGEDGSSVLHGIGERNELAEEPGLVDFRVRGVLAFLAVVALND